MKHLSEPARKLGFKIHAIVFVATMVLLAAINLTVGPPYWVLWILLGWGIGLVTHWWFVLGPGVRRAGAN